MKPGSTTAKVRIEVVPSHDLAARLQDVYEPPGAVSVARLPLHGPEKTVSTASELAGLGYRGPNATLNEALHVTAPHAAALVTQICLDPQTITGYVSSLRRNSIMTPVWVGVPGPVTPPKLVAMGARLGVGRSLKLAGKIGLTAFQRCSPKSAGKQTTKNPASTKF